MAKVRLQIELDENVYKCICGDGITLFNTGLRCGKTLLSQILVAIRHGTPTQTCANCIRRNNDFFKKWLNYKTLDKTLDEIKAEIAENGNSDINAQTVLAIIDKYRGKQNE